MSASGTRSREFSTAIGVH